VSEAPRPIRSRRAAREIAFRACFAVIVGSADPEAALESALDGATLAPEVETFVRSHLVAVSSGRDALSAHFEPNLAPEWPLNRLATTDRLALEMACHELWDMPGMPPKVTISEYVGLAKRYGSVDSGRFVNGVLAAVLRVSPKAEWDPSMAEADTEPAPEEPVPDDAAPEETVAECSPEHDELVKAGPWVIRSGP
jgi:transcription antitermination protein NusB